MGTSIPNTTNEFELPMVGFSVSRCIIDFAFTLHLVRGEESAYLQIETPFECLLPAARFRCDPAGNPEELRPALSVLHHLVNTALVRHDGALQVAFDGPIDIRIASHSTHEAWNFNGPDGLLIVCLPGGGISTYPPGE